MPWPKVNYEGERFGRLTAVRRLRRDEWLCQCVCGGEVMRRTSWLTMSRKLNWLSSCGCHKHHPPVKYAVLVDGEYRTVPELARLALVSEDCIVQRLKRGESSLELLLRPSRKVKGNAKRGVYQPEAAE